MSATSSVCEPMTSHGTLPTCEINDTAGQIRALKEEGCVVIPNALSQVEVEQTRERIDELKAFGFDRLGGIDHFKCVFNRSPYWLPFLDKAGVIDCLEATLGSDCHSIGMTAWRSHPGHGGWGIHTDHVFFPVEEELLVSGRVEVPMMLATAHYYLSDITIDLCPTYVIPGSHLSGRGPGQTPGSAATGFVVGTEEEWRGRKPVPVLVKAGDTLVFRSEVWHSGSKNETTDRVRYLLQVHYGRRQMAQKFSPYANFHHNPEVMNAATPRQQRIMGLHQPGAYD